MVRLHPKHRSCKGCCLGWTHPFVWLLTFAAGNSFLQPPTGSPRGLPQRRTRHSLLDSQDSMETKRAILHCSAHGSGDIDLRNGMMNARANKAEGRSPGAGLESAYDQADAAYADLIATSIDNQGIALGEEDIEELAKGGMMSREETERKSKGFIGDVAAIFEVLSGGAHIVKREDGTL